MTICHIIIQLSASKSSSKSVIDSATGSTMEYSDWIFYCAYFIFFIIFVFVPYLYYWFFIFLLFQIKFLLFYLLIKLKNIFTN